MEVILWWELSCDESYLLMKFILWWKLASDENKLVMKVEIVKEVNRSDGLWRFACGNVLQQKHISDHDTFTPGWNILQLHHVTHIKCEIQ